MSEAITIPQLTVTPAPTASRGDEGRAVPEATGIKADGDSSPRSFAEVLKSKATPTSASATDETADDTRPQVAQEDFSFLAVMTGIPLPSENPSTPHLLAQLTRDDPAAVQATLPAVSAVAEGRGVPAEAAGQALPALPPAGAPLADAPLLAAPAIPLALSASTISRPASPGPLAVAGAVPPAPTLAAAKAQEHRLPTPAPSTDRPMPTLTEVVGHAPTKQAQFAASTAISAEAGDMPDATVEFRPRSDRLPDHAGNIAPQATPPQVPFQVPFQAPSQQNSAVPVQLRVATPFAQTGWAQEVDQKLGWMVTHTRQQADLVLNPPDLGRIEVTLVVQGDEVNASFASPHQAVREAIEESLVRLRESLAESGINLGQTHVGRDSSRDAPFMKPEGDARQGNGSRRESSAAPGLPPGSGTAWQPSRSRGMVDVFA
ncbi:MAG: flagellar hook-length control protein FliK [Rhodocyclales bacterium]|nr:flagellar hook-length control protein FliK [Rhodocyclales bacterium]